jgi:hypothetical protein
MRTLLNGKRAWYSLNCLHKNTFLALSESSGSRSLFPVFLGPYIVCRASPKGFGRVSPTSLVFAARTQRATLETFANIIVLHHASES